MNKSSLKILCALSGALLLSACGHDNPVMKKTEFYTLVGYVKDSRFMSHNQQSEAWICPAYFAQSTDEATDKTRCEKWITRLYEKDTGDSEVAAEITGESYTKFSQEDFRDPKVWQAVIETLDSKEKS